MQADSLPAEPPGKPGEDMAGLRISPPPLTTRLFDPWGPVSSLRNGDQDSACLRGLLRLETDKVGEVLKTVLRLQCINVSDQLVGLGFIQCYLSIMCQSKNKEQTNSGA